jgi:hypothetical protein
MAQRMITYYSYLWNRNRGMNVRYLFSELPLCMRADVALAVARPMLLKVNICIFSLSYKWHYDTVQLSALMTVDRVLCLLATPTVRLICILYVINEQPRPCYMGYCHIVTLTSTTNESYTHTSVVYAIIHLKV